MKIWVWVIIAAVAGLGFLFYRNRQKQALTMDQTITQLENQVAATKASLAKTQNTAITFSGQITGTVV